MHKGVTTTDSTAGIVFPAPTTQTSSGPARTMVRCDCCTIPVAERVGNVLVIRSRHHGKEHTTVIPLEAAPC